MNELELAKQLMLIFLEELHEKSDVMGRELLAMENGLSDSERAESWANVFRAAHTIKGAASVVNVEPIRAVCHSMEDIFGYYRDHQQPMAEDLTSLMLQTVDAIEEHAKHLESNEEPSQGALTQLVPMLEKLAAEHISRAEAPASPVAQTASDHESQVVADHAQPGATSVTKRDSPGTSAKDSGHLNAMDGILQAITGEVLALELCNDEHKRGEILSKLTNASSGLIDVSIDADDPILALGCEQLTDLLSELPADNSPVKPKTISRILEAANLIVDASQRLRRGESLHDAPLQRLLRKAGQLRPAAATNSVLIPTESSISLETNVPPKTSVATAPEIGVETHAAVGVSATVQSPQIEKPSLSPATKPTTATPTPGDKGASIRVSAKKLDALLAHSGELLVARGRFAFRAREVAEVCEFATGLRKYWRDARTSLRHLINNVGHSHLADNQRQRMTGVVAQVGERIAHLNEKLDALSVALESDNRLLGQTCSILDDEVYHARMLPFADACGALKRAARDVASSSQKKVTLNIVGGEVEVDRSVLEGLKDPLLHLVRNAVDHGVETAEERRCVGKPAEATITVSAALRGDRVEVRVTDDGCGLDLERIAAIARKRGLEVPEDPQELARLIFASGFSTAKLITNVSGRGVGLDIVKSQVESLHGTVDVSFDRNGTQFTLMVPLTLTTIRALLVAVEGQTYAIPTSSIERLCRFGVNDVRPSAGRDCLRLQSAPVALVYLAHTLGLKSSARYSSATGKGIAVVAKTNDQRVALVVDEVFSEQEVLVKSLGGRIRRMRHFTGCTLLPTGKIALVLNSANIVRSALGLKSVQANLPVATRELAPPKRVLLADDSVTTRTLLKNILESAGYDVAAVVDGQHAFELASQQMFDIVVSDVDMPRMTGFQLTSELRKFNATHELPVVLVTARGTDNDKEQGVRAGANAYIVKGSFDQQELLDTVAQLV